MSYKESTLVSSLEPSQTSVTPSTLLVIDIMSRYDVGGLQELWVKMMDIFLPVHAITEALAGKYDVAASDLTSLFLSIYILTGCDTVSYLYSRGTRRASTTAIKHLTDLLPLCRYCDPEESLNVQEDVITAARRYMV